MNGKISAQTACQLCFGFEKLLAHHGWHVGLTGSCLYGAKGGSDLDLIVYPHIKDDGAHSVLTPNEVLALIGVTDIEHWEADYPGIVDYIFVGKLGDIKVDAFFLT